MAPAGAPLLDRTRHHIAVRLLPFLFLLYITNYLDRTNLAFAAIGMARDLQFNDRVFGMAIGIFFLSYLALQIPGALLVERWSARGMICATLVTWGSLTVLTALVHTPMQLYFARFVLGAAEAGFFPGVIVYLSHWFIREDRAKATSNFMAAIPLSLIVGSPVAGWILGHAWIGVQGWRWLFILEGLPAIAFGIVAYFFLTDWPGEATWLTSEQRQCIRQKLDEERPAQRDSISLAQTLRTRAVLLLSAAAFLQYFAFYTVIYWFPTILKRGSGFSDARVGLLGAIPYMAALLAMLVNAWLSDRNRERRWHAAVPLFIGAAGFAGLLTPPGSGVAIVLWFSTICLCMGFAPVFWTIPSEILRESTAAFAVGMINALASIAGFAGPYAFAYLHSRTGHYTAGFLALMGCIIAAGIFLLLLPEGKSQPVEPVP